MKTRALAPILTLSLLALLSACASQPFEYHSQNEISKGPGLLTGESGEVTLRLPGTGSEAAAAPRSTVAATATAGAAAGSGDYAEFEAFREFRRAKGAKSADYVEFQEWLEWKASRDKLKPKPAKGW